MQNRRRKLARSRPVDSLICVAINAQLHACSKIDEFSYLSVLLSVILGLAVTQILKDFRGLLLSRVRIRVYWPVIAAHLFPELVGNVWFTYPTRLAFSSICGRSPANNRHLHGKRSNKQSRAKDRVKREVRGMRQRPIQNHVLSDADRDSGEPSEKNQPRFARLH